jgi:hypothetical protein
MKRCPEFLDTAILLILDLGGVVRAKHPNLK